MIGCGGGVTHLKQYLGSWYVDVYMSKSSLRNCRVIEELDDKKRLKYKQWHQCEDFNIQASRELDGKSYHILVKFSSWSKRHMTITWDSRSIFHFFN